MDNPEILWAQSREKVFITLNIEGINEQNIEMKLDRITFEGKNSKKEYNLEIELLKIIDPNESTWQIKPNCVTFTLKKNPEVFWNKLSPQKYNNLRVDWNRWDIVEESDSDEETEGMTYQKLDMINNFKDFTKTLPSELMNKDLGELFPEDDVSDDCEETGECTSGCCGNSSLDDLNIENLDINKLDEELINKMEEGRITRKDRESLSSNDGDVIENSCVCCDGPTDETIPENE